MRLYPIYIILLSLFLFCSCQNQDESSNDSGIGYLSLSSLEVESVDVIPVSRAVNPLLAIEIDKADGTSVVNFAPGEAGASQKIELDAGDYILKTYSLNYGTSWGISDQGEPIYYAEQAFHVASGKVRYLTVNVPMINAGVSLKLPNEFGEWFGSYTFSVTSKNRNVLMQNGETIYLNLSPDEQTDIQFQLVATNSDGETNIMSDTYSNLQSGKIYQVVYSTATRSLSVR